MINFFREDVEVGLDEKSISDWIIQVVSLESKKTGDVNFIFCSDEYLLQINQQYLNHDTFTDIISFDYSVGNMLQGDIFISIDRVKENAIVFAVGFDTELRRVMIHGILHFCGYRDKTQNEKTVMRSKENKALLLFHVEQ